MPAGSSRKRERQYEHIQEGAEKRGTPEGRATEIAARTVNKERARSGEAKTSSRTSTRDPESAPQRGGQRSHSGPQGPTRDQLSAYGLSSPVVYRRTSPAVRPLRSLARWP
jgi:hypothetical protein